MNMTRIRMVALGVALGTTACVVFALPALVPSSLADEQPLKTVYAAKDTVVEALFGHDPDFVKPDWTIDDTVSTEVLKSSTISKIEFGRKSVVTIATTATGVYSSDGMTSPHIRYPGIEKKERPFRAGLAVLSGGGWIMFKGLNAGSFVNVVPFEGGELVVTEDGSCSFIGRSAFC
jgi:hypothetical protein